jgi:hypothetical protein
MVWTPLLNVLSIGTLQEFRGREHRDAVAISVWQRDGDHEIGRSTLRWNNAEAREATRQIPINGHIA